MLGRYPYRFPNVAITGAAFPRRVDFIGGGELGCEVRIRRSRRQGRAVILETTQTGDKANGRSPVASHST